MKKARDLKRPPTGELLDLELHESGERVERGFSRRVSVGLSWSLVNSVVSRCGQLAVGIVLARLVAPADFGVFAAALLALTVVFNLSEMSGSLLVRARDDVAAIAPTVNTIAIVSSAALTAICVVGASWFASLMGAPEAARVIWVLSISMLLAGPTIVPCALLTRAFRQDRRMAVDTIGFVASTVVSVSLAVAGLGVWSLAWGRVVGHAVASALVFRLTPARYPLGFDRGRARELLGFGLPLAGSNLLVFAVLNVDYVMVGSLLGPAELGFYLLAFNLASWPVTAFSAPVRSVALAGFSRRLEDEQRVRSDFVRALGLLMAVTLPLCVLLAVLGQPLVQLVYGARWAPAATALPFLAVLGAVRTAMELSYDFLVALGESRTLLWLQGLWLAALVPALAAGARLGGIGGVGAAHMAVALLVVVPAYLWVLLRQGVSIGGLARNLARPVVASVLVAVTAASLRSLLHTDFVELAIAGTAGLGVHALVVLPMRRELHRFTLSEKEKTKTTC
ncbi:MAG: lipopolysaccharide biosynthesis protein [Egibacteraceae bacterium]